MLERAAGVSLENGRRSIAGRADSQRIFVITEWYYFYRVHNVVQRALEWWLCEVDPSSESLGIEYEGENSSEVIAWSWESRWWVD